MATLHSKDRLQINSRKLSQRASWCSVEDPATCFYRGLIPSRPSRQKARSVFTDCARGVFFRVERSTHVVMRHAAISFHVETEQRDGGRAHGDCKGYRRLTAAPARLNRGMSYWEIWPFRDFDAQHSLGRGTFCMARGGHDLTIPTVDERTVPIFLEPRIVMKQENICPRYVVAGSIHCDAVMVAKPAKVETLERRTAADH